MPVVEINEKAKTHWDRFVQAYAHDGGFLQSWGWGDFQKSLGNKVYRLAILNNEGEFDAAVLVVKHELHFEYNYLYCPRGPVMKSINLAQLQALLDAVKNIAKEEKSFMIRLDPAWNVGNEQFLTDVHFRQSEAQMQPKCNFILDITKSADDILAGMKQKTRYNINLGQKKGVQVYISDELADLEHFWQLMKQTSVRDGFRSHGKEHYKKMFETLNPGGTLKLFLATYDRHTVASMLVAFFGTTATYLHGASADLYRGAMAPYLLQWHAVTVAQQRGCRQYDFGGVNGTTFNNAKWEGITRFKTGFGADTAITEYVGSYETILNPFVFAGYKFVKQIRG